MNQTAYKMNFLIQRRRKSGNWFLLQVIERSPVGFIYRTILDHIIAGSSGSVSKLSRNKFNMNFQYDGTRKNESYKFWSNKRSFIWMQ